jgi:hypothetical protein
MPGAEAGLTGHRWTVIDRDVARPEGKSSNSLVEVLVSWDELLEAA